MNIATLAKAALVIETGCALAMVGIAAYSAKKQVEINQTIAEGQLKIVEGNALMQNWNRSAARS